MQINIRFVSLAVNLLDSGLSLKGPQRIQTTLINGGNGCLYMRHHQYFVKLLIVKIIDEYIAAQVPINGPRVYQYIMGL